MEDITKSEKTKKNFIFQFSMYIVGVCSFLFFLYFFIIPSNRIEDKIIHISPNDSITQITEELKESKIIRNPFLLKLLILTFSGDRSISSGDYLFTKKINLLEVSWQLMMGKHNILPIKVIIKEGSTNEEIIKILSEKLKYFDRNLFLNDKRTKQGYLFPDTYFFFPLTTTDEVISVMSNNFEKRLSSIDLKIKSSQKDLSDIIIMASIIEKEAKGSEDSFVISGILWKRIELKMLLQVDIAPVTYKEVGLPSFPINNPGLSSIKSAMSPQESPYLFYLHDKNGQVHYAKNFEEHKKNIKLYLK